MCPLYPLLFTLGRIAEDRANCDLIAKEEAAIQQLVLMALSENPIVVGQACKTMGEQGANPPPIMARVANSLA